MIRFLLLVWLVPVAIWAEEDYFKNDSTGKLSEIISDYQIHVTKVLDTPRMFVMKGTSLHTRGKDIRSEEVIFTGATKKDRYLFANTQWGMLVSGGTRRLQVWDQMYFDGRKSHFRNGILNSQDIKETPELEEDIDVRKRRMDLVEPILLVTSSSSSGIGNTPRTLLNFAISGDLKSCQYNKNGLIEQVISGPKGRSEYIILYDPKENNLPVRCTTQIFVDGVFLPIVMVETAWTKNLGFHVPEKITVTTEHPRGDQSAQFQLEVEYAFEKDFKVKNLLDPSLEDWREPIRIQFNETWLLPDGPAQEVLSFSEKSND